VIPVWSLICRASGNRWPRGCLHQHPSELLVLLNCEDRLNGVMFLLTLLYCTLQYFGSMYSNAHTLQSLLPVHSCSSPPLTLASFASLPRTTSTPYCQDTAQYNPLSSIVGTVLSVACCFRIYHPSTVHTYIPESPSHISGPQLLGRICRHHSRTLQYYLMVRTVQYSTVFRIHIG